MTFTPQTPAPATTELAPDVDPVFERAMFLVDLENAELIALVPKAPPLVAKQVY